MEDSLVSTAPGLGCSQNGTPEMSQSGRDVIDTAFGQDDRFFTQLTGEELHDHIGKREAL